jgi:hypothetical protein
MSSSSDYLTGSPKPSSNHFKALLIVSILASAGYAQAQKILPIDNKLEKLDSTIQEQLFRDLREKLADPSSATIIGFKAGQDGAICGLIDTKTDHGRSTGYKPFAFDPEKRKLALPAEAQHDIDLHDDHWQEKLNAMREAARWMAAVCPTSEGK